VLNATNTFQASQTVNGTLKAIAGVLALSTIPFSATPTLDATQGNTLKIVLTGDVTSSSLVGAQAGQSFVILLCQDSIGGHTFAPPPNVRWNTVPMTDPNSCNAEAFIFDGTTAYNLASSTYVLGGTITGLTASGGSLVVNGGPTVSLAANANRFTFPLTFVSGQSYSVLVGTQPSQQTCTVSHGTGTIPNQDVTNVAVGCSGNTTVPGAPTGVSAVAGNASATVSWSAPSSDGGSPITGYIVTSNPGGGSVSAVQSPTTVTSLTNGTAYTFTVSARNIVGTGAPSAASSTVIPSSAPSAMATPTTSPGAASVTLNWTAPQANGAVIDLYQIDTVSNGVTTQTTAGGGQTSAVVGGIPACLYPSVNCSTPTTYSFRIRAHNANGFGTSSSLTAQVRPRVSYVSDNVHGIWAAKGCTSCHSGSPLSLSGPAAQAYNSILSAGANSGSTNAPLLACPTGSANCVLPTHPVVFTTSSSEYAAILQWISDGSQF
jgi:hypothetical protein